MKRAIIYARVSTVKQADDGLPIDSQVEQCRKKAEQLGAEVVRTFKDEGISGRNSDRPAFQEAVDYCGVFDIDYFIVWNTARFARNKIDAAAYKQVLRKGGTAIVYVASDIDAGSDAGWLAEGIFEMMDELYSRTVSKDTRRSMMKNARDGYYNGGPMPFGYGLINEGKRKRLAINEAESVIVREIFHSCRLGAGAKSIAMSLNAAGTTRRGRQWTKNAVANLLRNWIYAGFITFNRVSHDGKKRPESDWVRTKSHQAIVEEEDFMTVQRLLSERSPDEGSGSQKSQFLYTGLLRCGSCQRSLQIESATGRSSRYSYYQCSGFLKAGTCRSRRMNASEFDDWLTDSILNKILTASNMRAIANEVNELKGDWAKQRAQRRAALVSELRSVEDRRRKLYDVLELHGRDAPNLADFKPRLMEMSGQIRAIESSLTELEMERAPDFDLDDDRVRKMAFSFQDMIRACDNPRKVREFFASFIDHVIVEGEKVVINYRKDRLVNRTGFDVVHSTGSWLPVEGSLGTSAVVATLPEKFRRVA